jgi:hypothetical protein
MTAFFKPCLDCGALYKGLGARCLKCAALRYRGTALKPGGSGWEWTRLRAQVLKAQPYCVVCAHEGKSTLATTVDHDIERGAGGTDAPANLTPMCKAHHAAKHGHR